MSDVLNSILDTHPDIIVRYDTDNIIYYVNEAAARYFQRTKDTLLGYDLVEISAEELREKIRDNIALITSENRSITGVQQVFDKPGFDYVLWTTIGLFEDDKIVGYQSVGRDVTHRAGLDTQLKDASASLVRAQTELRAVLDAVPALIWYKDDQNKILHLNQAAADSMNMRIEDVQGQSTYDLFGEAAKAYHEDDLKVFRSGVPLRGLVEPYTPDDGEQGWVQTDKIPLFDGTDGPRILVVSTDISDLKNQEAMLESINKNLDDFASMVSHDLQAPLRKIGITVELMELELGDDLPDIIKPYLKDIMQGVDGMRELIRSFLTFMRSSPQGIQLSSVSLKTVLGSTLESFQDELDQHGASVTLPEQDVFVRGEAKLLQQVFQNLVSNSIKYRSPDRPLEIDFKVQSRNQFWSLFIQDNGVGVDPRFEDQIFDVFGRAKPESSIEGSGIGLALCRRILTFHGGTIELVPHDDPGSVFQIDLYKARRRTDG